MRLVETGGLGDCQPLHPPHPKIFAQTNFQSFKFRGVQYSEPCQTSKMELFAKINNVFIC